MKTEKRQSDQRQRDGLKRRKPFARQMNPSNSNPTPKQFPETEKNAIPSTTVSTPVIPIPIPIVPKTNSAKKIVLFTDPIQIQEISTGQKVETVQA